MGLSDFRTSIGSTIQVMPNIDESFEAACLSLFTEAFKTMKHAAIYDLTWKETRFSAHLVGYMRKHRSERDLSLRVDPEGYLYRAEILKGLADPDAAPRIDIKISGAWVHEDIYYGIESKILTETDWETRRASHLRSEYIGGFDRFVSGRYAPQVFRGCMAGYVVHGSTYQIGQQINSLLSKRSRGSECLTNHHSVNDCPDCYHSRHIRTSDQKEIRLSHVHLSFC